MKAYFSKVVLFLYYRNDAAYFIAFLRLFLNGRMRIHSSTRETTLTVYITTFVRLVSKSDQVRMQDRIVETINQISLISLL